MVIILMGVSGSGKTTIGQLLSEKLKWRYYDADDFHSSANVQKMKDGIPLTDDDRRPWLESLSKLIQACLDRGENAVLGCSALKESYREYLLVDDRVRLVYLKGDYETIQRRLSKRRGHFMNPELLESQFATLEEPEDDVRVDASLSPDHIVETIRSDLAI